MNVSGDLGQTYNSLSTLEHYKQSGGQTVLFGGDLSYADQYKYHDVGVRWDTWGHLVESIAAYQPWMWTAGNHDSICQICKIYASMDRLDKEFQRVDREKTPWLIVLMHAPIYNSNYAHYMEGESMRAVFERWFVQYKVDVVFASRVHAYERLFRISNINYNVSIDEHYPVPDKFAPVYITVGDGGNREGLASRFRDPQPDYSAFREASYGHSTLEILNRTHALYHWNHNDDGKKVTTVAFMLHNQYWRANGHRRRKLKKNYLHRVVQTIPLRDTL